MKMNVKTVGLIIAVILVLAGGFIVFFGTDGGSEGSTPQKKKGGGPRYVEVEVARKGDIARLLNVTGEVVATDTVVIAATKEAPISPASRWPPMIEWRVSRKFGNGK